MNEKSNYELITRRIYKEEDTGVIYTPKIYMPYEEIQFIEEYSGTIFSDRAAEISIIRLYSGEGVCILEKFDNLSKRISDYKKENRVYFKNN
jgi:hypothetical protein